MHVRVSAGIGEQRRVVRTDRHSASYACSVSHAQDGGKAAALAIVSGIRPGHLTRVWEVEPRGLFPRDARGPKDRRPIVIG
jgi:hypothetical protein